MTRTIEFKDEGYKYLFVFMYIDGIQVSCNMIQQNDTIHVSHSNLLQEIYLTFDTFSFIIGYDDIVHLTTSEGSYIVSGEALKRLEISGEYNLTLIHDLFIKIIYKGELRD
jgi:hypothetical protein